MKGLELSESYYYEVGKNALSETVPGAKGLWAAGLVGEGSECFSFDDDISRDHDWGPGFCVWVSEGVYTLYGAELEAAYNSLPKEYKGYKRLETSLAGKRVGIFKVSDFYSRFLGVSVPPKTNMEWLSLPEQNLSLATNGKVFEDPAGDFTKIRSVLLKFYPEEVRKKKIAACLARMAREGQYNFKRCKKRNDTYAELIAAGEFCQNAIRVLHLLNYVYCPYYKWALKSLKNIKGCKNVSRLIEELSVNFDEDLVEEICLEIIKMLKAQGLSACEGTFLQEHALEIFESIKDPDLKRLHLLVG